MYETSDHPAKVITIRRSDTVKAAADKMLANKVGCLIVNDENGKFAGIVTERDIVSRVVASSKDLNVTTVAEIMTQQVVFCSPDTPTSKAREIMSANKIRHLPIVDNGLVIDMLSARDLMGRQLLEDRAAAEDVAMLSTCLKSIDLNEVADIVTREVPKLFHAQKCVLYFHKKNGSAAKKTSLISCNECVCPKEYLNLDGNGGLFDGNGFCYDSIPEICEKSGAQSPRLVIPLELSGQKSAGCLVAKDSSANSEQSSGYLCMCGLAASAATNRELASYKAKLARDILNSHLTNARLYQQARLISLTDALTGVGSRTLLEDKLQAEHARAKRYKRPFSVAIIDLDNFKTINDILGHAIGDDALKKLAGCMKSQKRTPDVLARYGGDEFVILMPETRAENAVTLLERLRAKVHEIKLGEKLPMTISCGIAQSLYDSTESPGEMMRRADLALYEAKSAGRNCVRVWDKSMSKQLSTGDIDVEKIKRLQRRISGLSEQAEKMFIQSIWELVQALEAKDPYAKKHSENVMYYTVGIAEAMGIAPKQMEIIRRATMIHDIGKIGIPDAILSKPGMLTSHERSIIEQHPLIAVRILEKMTFLEREITLARHHHEKWNGQGYPDGLSGSSIPLGARIMAVADTLDALTSNRSYHNSRTVAEAIEILTDSSGYELDPEAVRGMLCWVEALGEQLGKTLGQLTPADLLDSQKQGDHSFAATLDVARSS